MGISGNDKAPMMALGGYGRAGAMRGGGHSPSVFVSINGVHYATGRENDAAKVLFQTLTIDKVKGRPHTATFDTKGVIPTVGQQVVITLGSKNRLRRMFGGQVLSVDEGYTGRPTNYRHRVSAIDFTWGLQAKLVTGRYTGSATTIVRALMEDYAPNYTTKYVQSGLATVADGITFTQVDLLTALARVASRIGASFYVDYLSDLHFYVGEESANAATPPLALTPTLSTLRSDVRTSRALESVVTRVYVEGGGGKAATPVEPGSAIIPVDTADWYQSEGGHIKTGSQIISYGGVIAGGTGTIVGPSVSPLVGPSLFVNAGGSIDLGTHHWAVTFVTASGETTPGPMTSAVLSALSAPPAPTVTAVVGGGITDGDHYYAVTYLVTGLNETTPSAVSSTVTMGEVAAPGSAPEFVAASAYTGTTSITPGLTYDFVCTFSLATSASDLTAVTAPSSAVQYTAVATSWGGGVSAQQPAFWLPMSSNTLVKWVHLWRRVNGSGDAYQRVGVVANIPAVSRYYFGGTFEAPGAFIPSAGAVVRSVVVDVPLGPTGYDVIGRRVYRTAAGGSQLKLLTTILNNTTLSYTDILADAHLGANAPTVNAALMQSVALNDVPLGPPGTTQRKIYRTEAGGSQLKLQSTILNNTTTTASDSTADSGLGANAPASDTSGLSNASGTVLAGATSILVANTQPFSSSGGWAVTGSGQVFRYGSISGSELADIPSSGAGALAANVSYGTVISEAPQLTGIPASGTGSVVDAIVQGEDLNLYVQVDDADAQARIAYLTGGDGIIEDFIQDRRIAYAECIARGTAHLDLLSDVLETLRYRSVDLNTQSAQLIHSDLEEPTAQDQDYRIQQVVVSGFCRSRMPKHDVIASSQRFTLEDLLQLARKAA